MVYQIVKRLDDHFKDMKDIDHNGLEASPVDLLQDRKLLAISKTALKVHLALADIYKMRRAPIKAFEHIKAALTIEPTSPWARYSEILLQLALKRTSRAGDLLSALLENNDFRIRILPSIVEPDLAFLDLLDKIGRSDLVRLVLDHDRKRQTSFHDNRSLSENPFPQAMIAFFKPALVRSAAFDFPSPGVYDHSFLVPAALGYLAAVLHGKGIENLPQIDLNMACHRLFAMGNVSPIPFLDRNRIDDFIAGGSDRFLSDLFHALCQPIGQSNIVLLSIPDCFANDGFLHFARAFCHHLKKSSKPFIVAGGSEYAIEFFERNHDKDGLFDFIVRGYGEEEIVGILHDIYYRYARKSQPIERAIFIRGSYDGILFPDYSGIVRSDYQVDHPGQPLPPSGTLFRDFIEAKTLLVPLFFIKGCPNSCAFCSYSTYPLSSAAKKEDVSRYCRQIKDRLDPIGFLWLNCSLNLSRKYMTGIALQLIADKTDILWSDSVKACGLSKDDFLLLRKSGCIRLVIGMESASQRLLDLIGKGIKVEDLEKTVRYADEAGIWVAIDVICGMPQENEDDIEQTARFIVANRNHIDNIYLHSFDLRYDSMMFRQPEKYGITNIGRIDYREIYQAQILHMAHLPEYSFDEIGGLSWSDKVPQIRQSCQKIDALVRTTHYSPMPVFLDEHLLFYLYRRYTEKAKVRQMREQLNAEWKEFNACSPAS